MAEEKVATLTEELHALRGKLLEAQRQHRELTEQLVPQERLKSELRKEKQMKEQEQQKNQSLEAEVQKLNAEISKLIKELTTQKSETLKYQTRCSDLESLTAQLGLSERGAQAELLRATEREQLMRVQAFQSSLACSRAEEEKDNAKSTVHSKEQQLCALREEWTVLSVHHAQIRDEVVEKRVMVNALSKEKGLLQQQLRELQQRFEEQQDLLLSSTAELHALQERLPPPAPAAPAVAATPEPTPTFGPTLVPCAARERPWRSAMEERELPGLAPHLQKEMRCQKSRRDYPRCAAGRQLRGRILETCRAPLFEN